MDQYAEEKRTEKNLIVRSGISEAETTNNKRLHSTFCIEAIQRQSIARPICDSRASCYVSDNLLSEFCCVGACVIQSDIDIDNDIPSLMVSLLLLMMMMVVMMMMMMMVFFSHD